MGLVSPDLTRAWVLLVHHAHALEVPLIGLQLPESVLEGLQELLAVLLLAGSLHIVDMSRQDEHEPAGTGWR